MKDVVIKKWSAERDKVHHLLPVTDKQTNTHTCPVAMLKAHLLHGLVRDRQTDTHTHLPEVNSDGTFQLLKPHIHEAGDSVKILKVERVGLVLVTLGLR